MKANTITAKALIGMIPEKLFVQLGAEHSVDYQVKKLYGLRIFKLLIYGLLSGKDLSFRILELLFDKVYFRKFAEIPEGVSTDHSSLAERLSFINVDYFRALFEYTCQMMSKHFTPTLIAEYKVVSFDSTLVAISSKLLKTDGIRNGRTSKKKDVSPIEVKFSIGFDGLNVKNAMFFNQQNELSENVALREIILASTLSSKEIAVFDRGISNRKTYEEFTEHQIQFVTRLIGSGERQLRYKEIKQLTTIEENHPIQTETLNIEQDCEVNLYTQTSRRCRTPFRLVIGSIRQTGEKIYFLTNMFDLTAEEVTEVYKRRWQIEVFFKFLKQELSLKHFLSRNENGIKVVLYTTLITAMLIYIYKHLNKVESYKMAKLKFINELERDILEVIIEFCKGQPSLLAQFSSA